MKDKKLLFFTDIQFLEPVVIEENPMLSKVQIRIAQAGVNRNRYNIPKDVLEDAAKTSLGLTPIVAYYNPYTGDFGEHGEQAVFDELGNYVMTADTQAVGVIPNDPVIFWDEDGYLVTYGYLWTKRYAEVINALDGRPQSMELSFNDTIMQQEGSITKILKTAFLGLCILGNDVTPAFEDASITKMNFSYQPIDDHESKIHSEVEELLNVLQFTFDGGTDYPIDGVPLVVDVDGEERDKVNREKVTDAVNLLDEAADLIQDQEARNIIDDAISGLVDAELDMKREANVLPVTEAANRGLQGRPGYKDGIVSVENLNYRKASNSLLKKNEDDNEEDKSVESKKNKKQIIKKDETTKEVADQKPVSEVSDKEKPVQEEVVEETPVKEEVVDKEEVKTSGETPTENDQPRGESKSEQEPIGSEEDAAKPETEGVSSDTIKEETVDAGTEVSTDPQGSAADSIVKERQTAQDKRTSALLSDVGDDELFDYLIERVAAADEMRTKLQDMLGNAIPEQLPEGQDVVVNDTTTQDDLGIEEVSDPSKATEPVVDVDSDKPDSVLAAEGEDKTDDESIQEKTKKIETDDDSEEPTTKDKEIKEETKMEETSEDSEDDDKKKKKLEYSLDFKAIVQENQELTLQIEKLKEENQSLLQFKLEQETSAKEDLLLEFNLSEEGKASLRKEFNNLSLDELEAQAALMQHREFKKAHSGQNISGDSIQFSLETEETELAQLTAEDSLAQFLEKISKKTTGSSF